MSRLHRPRPSGDEGFTLVELMVACSIAIVLVVVSLGVVTASADAVLTGKQVQNLNEEARQALNRMSRDIRQARVVSAAVNPDGPAFDPAGLVAVRFASDFDGDGCIGGATAVTGVTCLPYSTANPEDLTYCFQPGIDQLFIIDNQASATPIGPTSTSCSGGQPILAGNVSSFTVDYRSDLYRYDLDPSNGITTWREVDAASPPVGNRNSTLDVELSRINSVVLNVTMRQGARTQQYRTQVDLRNSAK